VVSGQLFCGSWSEFGLRFCLVIFRVIHFLLAAQQCDIDNVLSTTVEPSMTYLYRVYSGMVLSRSVEPSLFADQKERVGGRVFF